MTPMKISPKFPAHRLQDPKRQAELAIYRALESSTAPGAALYEPRFGPYTRGLDFAAWMKGIGRFALEGKGGLYSSQGASWWLTTLAGQVEIECPALQVWDGAMAFRDRIALKRGKGPFVLAVLVFPDMEPDAGIAEALADSAVHAIFGVADLTGKLAELAQMAQVLQPPTAADIERETALVMGAEPEPETPVPYVPELDDRQVIIQHVDTVNVYVGGDGLAGAEVSRG